MSLCLASGRNLQEGDDAGYDDAGYDDDVNDDGYDDDVNDDGNEDDGNDDDDDDTLLPNQQGCCSWHEGVCGCSGGRTLCCDGEPSPSCVCRDDDGHQGPTSFPTLELTLGPTPSPTLEQTLGPTPSPSLEQTSGPTPSPTSEQTSEPTTESPTPRLTKETEFGAQSEATEPLQIVVTQSSIITPPLWVIAVAMLLVFLIGLVSGWNVHYCWNQWGERRFYL